MLQILARIDRSPANTWKVSNLAGRLMPVFRRVEMLVPSVPNRQTPFHRHPANPLVVKLLNTAAWVDLRTPASEPHVLLAEQAIKPRLKPAFCRLPVIWSAEPILISKMAPAIRICPTTSFCSRGPSALGDTPESVIFLTDWGQLVLPVI